MTQRPRNALIVEAVNGGKTIRYNAIPTNSPGQLHDFVGKALGMLATATARKHNVVLCVCPKWKAWIIQHILRVTK